jgi:hypothetical protein
MIADELSRLREADSTGILHVTGEHWPSSMLYLMNGEIVACSSDNDAANLERILLSSRLIDENVLTQWRPWLEEGADLVDMMVADGQFPTEELIVARSSLFDDNFAWTLAHPSPTLEFEERGAVFPDNIQFDLDGSVLIGDVVSWIESVRDVLLAAATPEQRFAGSGELPDGWSDEDWAQLCTPRSMAALLELLGPPRTEAAMLIKEWLGSGLLTPIEGDYQAPATAEDDYAKAARGDFVRSYEVLDKVDLTGVPILGLGTESENDIEATLDHDETHVAADEDTLPPVALGEYQDSEKTPASPASGAPPDQPVAAVEFIEELPPSIDNWEAMSDEPPPVMEDEELTAEAESWDHIEAIESLASLEAMDGAPPPIAGSKTGFSTNELAAFGERISTFNNIFRIIFETFSAHLGANVTSDRFAELVTSSEREQAALFAGLQPEPDGSLSTDALITNLSGLDTDDLDDLLKGGLYELLFSHLSDSKDLLPGDAEATMMERLVVFERQLNQP